MSTTQEEIAAALDLKPMIQYMGFVAEKPQYRSGWRRWIKQLEALPERMEAAIDAAFEEGRKRTGWSGETETAARDRGRAKGVSALKGAP